LLVNIKKIVIGIIIGLVLFFILFKPTPVLEVVNLSSKSSSFCFKIKPTVMFSIKYTHSVARTPVVESFYINENYQIVLSGMIYESLGAGLPSEGYSVKEGKFEIKDINQIMEVISLRVSSIAKHILIFKNREIKLWSLFKDGTLVRIKVKKVPLFLFLLKHR